MASLLTLGGFANRLAEIAAGEAAAETRGLEKAAVIIETEAKRVLGTHDYGWPPLSEETIAHKSTGDSPLLETGAMRDSIEHTVQGRSAFVGSNSDTAVFQENGTSRIPPRPFLAGAASHKGKEAAQAVAEEIFTALKPR